MKLGGQLEVLTVRRSASEIGPAIKDAVTKWQAAHPHHTNMEVDVSLATVTEGGTDFLAIVMITSNEPGAVAPG